MVEPDETVLYKVRPTMWQSLRDFLRIFAIFAAVIVGLDVLTSFVEPNSFRIPYALLAVIGLLVAYMVLARGEALLTSRRFLRRRGFIRPRVTEIPLSQVRDIIWLERGSTRGLGISKNDNCVEELSDLPDARRLALEIAKAVGRPSPLGPTPMPLRVRGLLAAAGLIGAISGFFLAILALGGIAISTGFQLAGVLAVFALVGMLVPLAGAALGWLTGLPGVLLVLHRKVSAEDLRSALHMVPQAGEDRIFTNDYVSWGRPILVRLAGWLYGEPMGRPGKLDEI